MRRVMKWLAWGLGGVVLLLAVAAGGGYLWLKNSPYWAGITLFAEDTRVENFRDMERVFPSRPVPRDGSVWAFASTPAPLPESYSFGGETREIAAFLDRTETTGLMVIRGDDILHEEYRLGATEDSLLTSWSMAKSVLGTLTGIALEEGHIASLRDPAETYVPALEGTDYGAVPIEDLLTMSSGIGFDEDYDAPLSDINMLFIRAMAMAVPMEEMLAGYAALRVPGEFNDYISSDSMALGLVLEGATGMPVADYLASRLWGPMGAEADATWSTDRLGREFALCCLNARLRDWARFGRLWLEGGARDGVQIVPEAWVAASVAPEAAHLQPGDNPASSWSFGYGYKWWIPEDPEGDFTAIGVWGQYVYVHPGHGIVIVKTSADPEFDDNDHESVAAFRAIAAHYARDGGPQG